ncbi:hypothetical protein K440DRAFT_591912 [Wilcoxina mikolae CBS 423.85]|nr:hypothetical protein K440DRAFT_591912 [Wilcoxina mikolae CBS 423.85]
MTRDRLLGGTRLAEIESRTFREGELNTTRTLVQYREAHEIMSARLAEAGRIMNGWIYDENSVIVKCEVYVWTVMIAAIILVVGGLVIGFTVQSRIKGVDPFNITTYCWVLAAFVILVGKSVRVETWSWRDFLLRRVVCRSVSELHAVTRVPEQIILAKLLSDEDISILNTRGPFNSVFRNTANDGFSIDHPLTMWTMLLSGLIMVKVSTNQGSALVCLDVRNGTKYKWVRNGAMQTKDMYLVCPEMDRAYSRSETLPLKTRKFEWQGILGLYSNKTAKFI